MKYFLIAILLSFVFFNLSFAQVPWQPGYIVKINGDTIKGFIEFETDEKLSQSINFLYIKDGTESLKFSPDELNSFGFHSDRVFKSVKFGTDSMNYFAKKISSGKINLFIIRFEKSDDNKYHLSRTDTVFQIDLLPPSKKNVIRNGKNYTHRDNLYIGNLNLITENTIPKKELKKVKYRYKSIQNFINRYNDDYSIKYPTSSYRENYKYSFDITAGIPVYFRSEINDYRLAVYADRTNIENSNKLAYRMGISFRYWKRKEGNYEEGSDIQKMLKVIPLGIRWQSEPKKIMPYGFVGLGFIFWKDINFVYENEEKVNEYNDNIISLALNLGIGVKIKVGNNYLLAEYTPALIESIGFFNIGYSF